MGAMFVALMFSKYFVVKFVILFALVGEGVRVVKIAMVQ